MWSSTALRGWHSAGVWHRLILALVLVAACGEQNQPPQPPAATPTPVPRSQASDAPSRAVSTPEVLDTWRREQTILHLTPAPAGDGPPPDLSDIHFVSDERGFGVTSSGGIYRTDDGGDSWHEVYRLDGSELSRVRFLDRATGVAIGVRGCAPGFSCAGPSVLLRTDDGGDDWELIEPQGFQDLIVRPWGLPEHRYGAWRRLDFTLASRQVAFATDNPPAFAGLGEVLVTADGGHTWQALAFADGFRPYSISFPTPDQGFVTGRLGDSDHQLRASHDGGQTWQVVHSTKAIRLGKAQFLNESEGFVAGTALALAPNEFRPRQTLLHTMDGGVTWESMYTWQGARYPPTSAMVYTFLWFHFADPLVGWATHGQCDPRAVSGARGGDGGCALRLLATNNGGRTWTRTGKSLGRLSSAGTTVWSLQGTVLFRSEDGGATWQGLAHPSAVMPQWVQFISAQVGWVQTNTGFWETQDGGESWVPRLLGLPVESTDKHVFTGSGTMLAHHAGDFQPGMPIGSAYLDAALLRSDDTGRTWHVVTLPEPPGQKPWSAHLTFAGAEHGWLAVREESCSDRCPDRLMKSSDGGRTWRSLSPGLSLPLPWAGYGGQSLSFGNSQYGAAVGEGGRDYYQLLQTADGGQTWTAPRSPRVTHSSSVSYVGADHIWLTAVRSGAVESYRPEVLLHSSDRGQHWTVYEPNIPFRPIQVQFVTLSDGWMIANSNPHSLSRQTGLFSTRDGGHTWRQVWPMAPVSDNVGRE
jgi:photosystem II stability/assembly factor-like uncharacterized protein